LANTSFVAIPTLYFWSRRMQCLCRVLWLFFTFFDYAVIGEETCHQQGSAGKKTCTNVLLQGAAKLDKGANIVSSKKQWKVSDEEEENDELKQAAVQQKQNDVDTQIAVQREKEEAEEDEDEKEEREYYENQKDEHNCDKILKDATESILKCFESSKLRDPNFLTHVEKYYSLAEQKGIELMIDVAKGEALNQIEAECDPIRDLQMDWEGLGAIRFQAKRSAAKLVNFLVEILEDPRSTVYMQNHFGSKELADIFHEALEQFGKVCESDGTTLFEEQTGCKDHLNLDAFLRALEPGADVKSCSVVKSELLQQHHRLRSERNHRRAKIVQVLHSEENKLGKHFAAHLRHGGSERDVEMLIAHAVSGTKLTKQQRQMLLHVEKNLPDEHITKTCKTWSEQRDAEFLEEAVSNSVLMKCNVYRSYMDCLCGGNELKLVCQSEFLRNSAELGKDLEKRNHQLLRVASENQDPDDLVVAESNSTAWPVGLGPCLLSDAFSCEVCLSTYCAPLASPRNSGRKNRNSDDGPFVSIKNMLTAKANDFKISCTACASIQPGEKISFEIEMYMATSFGNAHTMFTSTKIGVDAKTCIGPGSPLRALFDTLGINACKSNLKAEYFPFLGDLSVEGGIPGPVAGTWLRATFDTAVHDPPGAVRSHCEEQRAVWKGESTRRRSRRRWLGVRLYISHYTNPTSAQITACYNQYKNMAGPMLFSAAVTVPLIVTSDFEIVKASGPHSSGAKWRIELFQLPFDQVIQAIKDLWDNHAGPAMEDALNTVGEGVSAAGEWTVGAADSAGKWSMGAASTVGNAAAAGANVVGNTVESGGHAVGHVFGGRRRRRFF